ncbi:unnamed protein product [Linum trigynum]|uniref:Uncharacterized protein n=1 Tax=Linum trigynum TaxID=586398 RepID=A0AAV2CWM3_9ROSI
MNHQNHSPAADLNHSDRPPDPGQDMSSGCDTSMSVELTAVNESDRSVAATEANMTKAPRQQEILLSQQMATQPLSYANAVMGKATNTFQNKIA